MNVACLAAQDRYTDVMDIACLGFEILVKEFALDGGMIDTTKV